MLGSLVAAAVMALPVWLLAGVLEWSADTPLWTRSLWLSACMLIGVVVFGAVARLLRVPEAMRVPEVVVSWLCGKS